MQSGINIEEIKKYNASLREYKEKSSKIRAEIEFNQQELARQCSELTKALGVEVTPDNVVAILEDRVAKINNTMAVGNEILNRIKAEEAAAVAANTGTVNPVSPVATAAPVGGPQAPNLPGINPMSGHPMFANLNI